MNLQGVYMGFIGETIKPASSAPSKIIGYSGIFGSITDKTFPGHKPC